MKKTLSYFFLATVMLGESFAMSIDDYLLRLDDYLSPKTMAELIPNRKALDIYRLAEDEDMEVTDDYLISDILLRNIQRSGLIDTEFGKFIEDFQNECDKLNEIPRREAIARWRSLWLEKVSNYLRYVKSLKRVWTYDLSQTIDQDSNVRLTPQDQTTNTFSDKSDIGATHAIGLHYRPFVNHKRWSKYNYQFNLGGMTRKQASVKEVEYDTWSFGNEMRLKGISSNLTSLKFYQAYERSYTNNPTDPRMEFDQWTLGVRGTMFPMVFKSGYFKSASFTGGLSYKMKNEFMNDNGIKTVDEDIDTITLSLSQNFIRVGSGIPLETMGWSLSYQTQDVSPNDYRKFSYFSGGANYSRSLSKIIPKFPTTWRSSIGLRLKDWGDARTATGFADNESETQYTVSTSLRARWTANFSSRLALSYLHKDKGVTNSSDSKIDQFKITLNNTILTF